MALIYAEDFQCLAAYGGVAAPGNANSPSTTIRDVTMFTAMGFDQPAINGTSTSHYNVVTYDTTKKALLIRRLNTSIYQAGAQGLQRSFRYSGDTVRFGFNLSLANAYLPDNLIATFEGMYTVGFDSNGNYTLNGISTDTTAIYGGIDTAIFHEVVFTPTTVQLWISKTMIAEQTRQSLPVRTVLFGGIKTTGNSNAAMWIFSLIVSDNTGTTFNGPIGRKLAKTYEPAAALSIGSTITATPANATAIATITRLAESKSLDVSPAMIGSLVSPLGYVANSFSAVKNAQVPVAAIMNLQVKRRSPAGDGMAPFPYLKIGSVKVRGTPMLPSSLWSMYSTEIPISLVSAFTDFEMGYEQDYLDIDRVFASDHVGVTVWGSPVDKPYALAGNLFTSKTPTATLAQLTNTTISAYVTDYTKSTLALGMTRVNNTTFVQDQ